VLLPVLTGLCLSGPAAGARAEEAKPSVTFNKDVGPLVFRHCATCHRPGEVAPFPLLSYRDVSKRADLIREVTAERSMPPWKALPTSAHAHFADERRLTDEQVATIARWVDAGAPEGDPAEKPEPPSFTLGWQLGEPDLVVTMPEPYELVAEGDDVYRGFVLPFQVPPGKYLKAVEYRPGNRRVVHHAVFTTMPRKAAEAKLASGDGKSFPTGLAPPGQLLPGQLAFWTPGMVPIPLPEDYAAEFPPGSALVMQLHLHPSGKPETEQSTIGFHFSDEKPRGRLRLMILSQNDIQIEPGEASHAVTASKTIKDDVEVYGVFPHMHLLGRTVNVTATLPDGTTQPLIAIDDWNFNWQLYYRYATPLRLPAGTRLDGRWTFDNSADNPFNPSRPPKRVTYGEQTSNEMAILVLDLMPGGGPKGAGERAQAPRGDRGAP
jgi:hypothetical protein